MTLLEFYEKLNNPSTLFIRNVMTGRMFTKIYLEKGCHKEDARIIFKSYDNEIYFGQLSELKNLRQSSNLVDFVLDGEIYVCGQLINPLNSKE